MKKLFLFTVLVLAFAATAYSQDAKLDFRASGFIDARSELWRWNNSTQLIKSSGSSMSLNPAANRMDAVTEMEDSVTGYHRIWIPAAGSNSMLLWAKS